MTEQLLIKRAKEEFVKHNLLEWRLVVDTRTTQRAGQCRHGKREIGISKWLIDNNPIEEVTETLLHEIAHALTKGAGHSEVWRRKCIEIGGKGLTYWNSGDRNVTNPNPNRTRQSKRYYVTCGNCGMWCYKYRKRNNVACGTCCNRYNGGKFTDRYLLSYEVDE